MKKFIASILVMCCVSFANAKGSVVDDMIFNTDDSCFSLAISKSEPVLYIRSEVGDFVPNKPLSQIEYFIEGTQKPKKVYAFFCPRNKQWTRVQVSSNKNIWEALRKGKSVTFILPTSDGGKVYKAHIAML